MNSFEEKSDHNSFDGINVNFSGKKFIKLKFYRTNIFQGLAENIADLLLTMSRSTNGSIIVQNPKSDSVSLLSQFNALEKNIKIIKSTNELLEASLSTIKDELNKTKNDLQMEINLVSVCYYMIQHTIQVVLGLAVCGP